MRERLTQLERLVGRRTQLPRRLADAVEGDPIGFLLAGFIAQLPQQLLRHAVHTHAPAALKLIENVIVGPIVAMLSFVCSVGNVPLAAVLWSGGISFAGVIAFIFADLIVAADRPDLPQVLRQRLRLADRRTDVRDDGAARR